MNQKSMENITVVALLTLLLIVISGISGEIKIKNSIDRQTIVTDYAVTIKEKDIEKYLEETNSRLYGFVTAGIKTDNIVRDYFELENISLDETSSPINHRLVQLISVKELKQNDILLVNKDGVYTTTLYLGDGKHILTDSNGTLFTEDLDLNTVVKTGRVVEEIDKEKFIKSTAIIETNDRPINNKLYYGRYQLAKKYLPYYMERLGVKVTKTPSEELQRQIVELIMEDSIKYLEKYKLPVNEYSVRVVYNLGRTNTSRFVQGKLSNKLIASNLPRKLSRNHETFRQYWCMKVCEVYKEV